MIHNRLMQILLGSTFIYSLLTIQLFGQVVTPSLNIISKPIMPAASSWSKLNSVGGEYKDGNGKRKLDGNEIYDLEVEGSIGVVGLSIGNLDIDAYVDEARFDTKYDATYDGDFINDFSETYVSFSLTGDGDVTVGAAIHELARSVFAVSDGDEDVSIKQSGLIGSFTVKVFESVFLGGGVERVSETNSLSVDNEWTNATGGIAFWFGQDTDSQFRVEASVTESPKAEKEVDTGDTKNSAYHPSSRTNRINVDLMMNGLLFSYSNINQITQQEITNSSTGESVDKSKTTINEGSVQWVPEEGMILGFAFKTFGYKEVYEDNIDSFKINLGFIF
jgi:hypothetical protein